MIRHIVLARLRADPAEIAAIFADLDALRAHLPGMRAFHAGANISTEKLARGFTHAFSADFDDAAARDAYLVHPAHQKAGGRLVAACEGGAEGLVVVDVEI